MLKKLAVLAFLMFLIPIAHAQLAKGFAKFKYDVRPVQVVHIVSASSTPTQLVAQILDTHSNPVPGERVVWMVTAGDGTVTPSNATSDAQGFVRAQYTPGKAPESIVTVTDSQGGFAQFKIQSQGQAVTTPAQQLTAPQIQVAVNAATVQLNNVRQRLDQLRFQNSPTISEALRVGFDGQALPPSNAMALRGTDPDGTTVPQKGGGASADRADGFERWGAFVNGDVDIGRRSAVGTQSGFKVNTYGVTAGVDYRFTGNHVLGASIGLLKADADIDQQAGDQNVKGYSFSVFGSYVPAENAYIDGIVNVGHNKYDGHRQLTLGGSADSDTSGNQLGISLSTGYAFNRGPWALIPYGRVEYIDAKINGFSERGNEAISVSDQRVRATTLTLGAQTSYAISTSWGVFMPNGRLELQRLARNDVKAINAGLLTDATPGAIPILGEDRNFGTVSLGASAIWRSGISAFFNYERLFGKSGFSDDHYTLAVRVEF